MAIIKNIYKPLIVGTLNSEYEKIYNCRVVEPTFEKGLGLHNEQFFLDKRLGMLPYHKGDYHFTDDIVIDGFTYYLYNNDTECFVGVGESNGIKKISGPFPRNEKTPIKFAFGRGAKGPTKHLEVTINNGARFDNNKTIINENGIYEDGYIALDVGEGLDIQVGDYVLFKDNIFAGGSKRIDLYENGKIYIIGINDQGSIPTAGTKVDIYSKVGKIPVIGTADGVRAIHINGSGEAKDTNILGGDIEDIVTFNEELFALKNNVIYFSTQHFTNNLQFYSSRNRKYIEGSYKLVSNGKFLLIFADDNRLVSPIAQTAGSNINDYSFYPLDYKGKLYSKYAYIYVNNALYIVQSDKMIMNVNIDSLNATAFNLKVDSITSTVRGLMSDIEDYDSDNKGFIIMNYDFNESKVHMFYQKQNNTTIEYEYDHQFKHWLLHTYDYRVYKKTNRFLKQGYVSNIGGYKDLDKEYKQDINYFIFQAGMVLQVGYSDMIMGLIKGEKLEYNFDVEPESLHGRKDKHIEIKANVFDTLPTDHSLDYLNISSNGRKNQHYGTVTSIRRNVRESSRMFRFSVNGYKRFIYGSSNIFYKEGNLTVHEVENSF